MRGGRGCFRAETASGRANTLWSSAMSFLRDRFERRGREGITGTDIGGSPAGLIL
jgi:hypothetical protein